MCPNGAPGEPIPLSPEAAARARKIEIENEKGEIDLAKKRREVLSIKKVFELVSKEYGSIRSRILAMPQALAADLGLTPEQTAVADKICQDCMTDLSGEKAETWDDMAQEADE